MNILKLIHEITTDKFYYILALYFVFVVIIGLYTFYNKFLKKTLMNPDSADKFNLINKMTKLDNKCYMILYNTYDMIGSSIDVKKSEMFDEKYLLRLNDAKNIFYGVKRNKKLIKSNYLLMKIFKKISLYDIDKSEIDNTIIYLILLVLNKKK